MEISNADERKLGGLVTEVIGRNPSQLSFSGTHLKVQEILTQIAQGASADVMLAELRALVAFRQTRVLEVPVLDFRVANAATIGGVTFLPFHYDSERANATERRFLEADATRLHAVARVECPGDNETAREHLVATVSRILHVMTGACWPLYSQRLTATPSVFGTMSGGQGLFYRLAGIDHFNAWHAAEGYLPQTFEWPDSLIYFGGGRGALEQLVQRATATTIESKLLTGLEWLGEAAGLGTLRSRYLRIAVAFEAMVGDQKLQNDGLTAGLAERAAFLVGVTEEERRDIDARVRSLYGRRSRLVHGDERDTDEQSVIDFGHLSWRVATGLAIHLADIGDDLAGWTKRRRYR